MAKVEGQVEKKKPKWMKRWELLKSFSIRGNKIAPDGLYQCDSCNRTTFKPTCTCPPVGYQRRCIEMIYGTPKIRAVYQVIGFHMNLLLCYAGRLWNLKA